jgi:hypothetical protein
VSRRLHIQLRNNSERETRTEAILRAIESKYDLQQWLYTDRVTIDEADMPHSHPVLTLGTAHSDNEPMLLAELLHEQLHWFEEERAPDRDRAMADLAKLYPAVPHARPEGAGSEGSTRLHLLVCFLEYEALVQLLGTEAAVSIVEQIGRHHYGWVYRTVLRDHDLIRGVVLAHDLRPGS